MIPNPSATDELMPQTLNSPQRRFCGVVHVSAGKLHVATRSVQLVFVRSTEPHPIKSPTAKLHIATRSVEVVFVRSTKPRPIKSPTAKNKAIIVIFLYFYL